MLPIDLSKLGSYFVYQNNEPLTFVTPFFMVLFTFFFIGFLMVQQHHRNKIIYLTVFSLYFYYKSSGVYFMLLLASAISDYSLAIFLTRMGTEWKRKAVLVFSIVVNLGLLIYFKYTNFFLSLFNFDSGSDIEAFDIFLPIGISFFTFQSISYIIDVYRKEIGPISNFVEYCFFISFFPQLVAGPILRAKDFLPQIQHPKLITSEALSQAFFLIITGLFKKAVISDYISINFVDRIFDSPASYSGLENLLGIYGYAIQIYCDFSGYSDMAIGIALLLGYSLPVNFDSPYTSSSITEFWHRWHISLSSWLREYLYIPLGGNRKGKLRQYLNLFLTMLLGGLWHGASLNFIVWGGLHGFGLAVDKLIKEHFSIPKSFFMTILGGLFTFHFVCLCWIFFRAESFEIAGDMFYQMAFSFHPELALGVLSGYGSVFLLILCGFLLHIAPTQCTFKAIQYFHSCPLLVKSVLLSLMIFLVAQVRSADIQPFIYFQF